MIRSHVAAVKALLATVTLYDGGQVPDNAVLPYAVLYADGGKASVDNLADLATRRDWSFQTTSVGADPDQARWTAEKVQAALVGATPVVAGRTCGRIRHDVSRDAEPDFDVVPPVVYAVDRFRFLSVPS